MEIGAEVKIFGRELMVSISEIERLDLLNWLDEVSSSTILSIWDFFWGRTNNDEIFADIINLDRDELINATSEAKY